MRLLHAPSVANGSHHAKSSPHHLSIVGVMAAGPENLLELTRVDRPKPDWLLDFILPDFRGGTFKPEVFSTIDETPEATAIRLSGLRQDGLEYFVSTYGSR